MCSPAAPPGRHSRFGVAPCFARRALPPVGAAAAVIRRTPGTAVFRTCPPLAFSQQDSGWEVGENLAELEHFAFVIPTGEDVAPASSARSRHRGVSPCHADRRRSDLRIIPRHSDQQGLRAQSALEANDAVGKFSLSRHRTIFAFGEKPRRSPAQREQALNHEQFDPSILPVPGQVSRFAVRDFFQPLAACRTFRATDFEIAG